MSMFPGKRFVWALIAACVFGAAVTRAAVPTPTPRNSPEALRDFGVEKSEPIESSFFFYAGKYVEMPYVVERRGLDILINGHCVRPGPEYPPFEYDVSQDPGDPPPGASPFDRVPKGTDRRTTYWARKNAYLRAHYHGSAYVEKMVENYRKSTQVASVEPRAGSPVEYVVTLKDGSTVNVDFVESFKAIPRDKESDLKRARQQMQDFEDGLRGGGMMLIWRGREVSTGGPGLVDIIGALLSSEDPEVRLENLEKAGFTSRPAQVLAAEFEPSEQLKARYEAMKAGAADAESKRVREAAVSEMEGALDIGKVPIVGELPAKEEIAEPEVESPAESPAAGAEQDGGRGGMIAVAGAILVVCVVVGIALLLRGKRAARAKG